MSLSPKAPPKMNSLKTIKDVTIAVMGATGSGKSTFINLISGSKLPVRVGTGFESCTSDVDATAPFTLQGHSVVLFDTPGFNNTTKSDTDILKLVAAFLAVTYEKGATLSGVIYMHRINDGHMGDIAERNFTMFRNLCGDKSLKNVAIVTNFWSKVDATEGAVREAQLCSNDKFFKPVLDKQGKLFQHDGTLDSARKIVEEIMKNQPIALDIQVELEDEHKSILGTAAGTMLYRELGEQECKHAEVSEGIKEDMDVAIDERDEEWQKELQISEKELEAKIERVQTDRRTLEANLDEGKARMAQRLAAAHSGGTKKNENRRIRKQEKQARGHQEGREDGKQAKEHQQQQPSKEQQQQPPKEQQQQRQQPKEQQQSSKEQQPQPPKEQQQQLPKGQQQQQQQSSKEQQQQPPKEQQQQPPKGQQQQQQQPSKVQQVQPPKGQQQSSKEQQQQSSKEQQQQPPKEQPPKPQEPQGQRQQRQEPKSQEPQGQSQQRQEPKSQEPQGPQGPQGQQRQELKPQEPGQEPKPQEQGPQPQQPETQGQQPEEQAGCCNGCVCC